MKLAFLSLLTTIAANYDHFGIHDYAFRAMHDPIWRINKIDDILASKDCWVIFNGENPQVYEVYQDMGLKYMGSVMYGFLRDMKTASVGQGKLLDFEKNEAYVFPYGDKDTKLQKMSVFKNMDHLIKNDLPPMPAEIDYDSENFKSNFIHKAHKNVPEKVPVIINIKNYIDDNDSYAEKVPTEKDHKGKERSLVALALIRVFADIFDEFFSFTVAYQEDADKMVKLTGIHDLEYPEMFVPIGDPKDGFKLSFERHWLSGDHFKMEPLMNFIVKCADVTRIKLHGDHKHHEKDVKYMTKAGEYFRMRMPNNWKGYESEQWQNRDHGGEL